MPSLKRLVVATHNKGKWHEFALMLTPFFEDILSAGDLGLSEPDETGTSFAENALLKGHAAAQASQSVSLADDSGLCVTSLDGKPGIYSARWGGASRDFQMAMARVHKELGDCVDRSAYFICSLALVWPDGKTRLFEGRVDGHIAWPPRGTGGHGYDPFFIPKGYHHTFAEMTADVKQQISHRGKAVQLLLDYLKSSSSDML